MASFAIYRAQIFVIQLIFPGLTTVVSIKGTGILDNYVLGLEEFILCYALRSYILLDCKT